MILALILSISAHASANDCPADQSLKAKSMSPENFRQWLKRNSESLKTVEDVICCLPQNYLKNYLISYSGRSGQTGAPESPRVFLFDGQQKTSTTVLTFNGGDAYLNEPHNIEMGYIKDQKKFEIYDIEFYKRFAQMSEKNPVRCLRCHADMNSGEARPFFHMNGSANFVAGVTTCSPEEDEVQAKAQAMALHAVIENPRFRCLDRGLAQAALSNEEKNHKWNGGTYADNLKKLQGIFSHYQKNRLAQLVHASDNYNSYRFALVGAEICPEFKPSEWLPPEVLSQHHIFSTLNTQIAGVENEDQLKGAVEKLNRDQEGRARGLRRISKSDFDLKRGSFRPAFQSWLCPSANDFAKATEMTIPSDPYERALAKFQIDSKMRIFPKNEHTDTTALMRYLLDGRGIDTSAWTLSFNPKEDLHAFDVIARELIAMEPSQSPLKEKSCEKLKQNSLKAFLPNPPSIKAR